MIMEELIPLNILIADRSYRIKARPQDEEAIRKTLKVINDKIIEFKTQFAGKDMQDYISMVVIWYATQTGSHQAVDDHNLGEALSRIESMLDGR